jgi:uncharacterized protein (DUF924 family)
MTPRDVIHFWLDEVGESRWFSSDAVLDTEIRRRFVEIYEAARDGKLADWEDTTEGAVALLILLDQFPRNMFRGRAEAFATDATARDIAMRAVDRGFDMQIAPPLRMFFYMPLMHSEHPSDQKQCVALVAERLGKENEQYRFALMHHGAIERFGRFPARNAALGRQSTAEEEQFLAQPPGA